MINNQINLRNGTPIQSMKQIHRHGQPVSRESLRGVITQDILEEMNKRNQARSKEMIQAMGSKWICHPLNKVTRKDGKVYK